MLDQTTLGIDGHCKLKSFVFSLHGCIDGFSRRLLWLEVSSSNKKPENIDKFYLDAVKQLQSIPKKLKADDGTGHYVDFCKYFLPKKATKKHRIKR